MYPVLLRIGGVEITSFGVMVALGALASEPVALGLSFALFVSLGVMVAGAGVLSLAKRPQPQASNF